MSSLSIALESSLPLAGPAETTNASTVESTVGLESAPFLADHAFQDMVVVPGALYVELALHLERQRAKRPTRLVRNVSFENPVILNGSAGAALTVEIAERGNGRVEYAFREAAARQAAARLEIVRDAPMPAAVQDTFSIEAFRSQAQSETGADALYAQLRANGNQYGPAFRRIASVWRSGSEALARIELSPGDRTPAVHGMHPATLDALAQSLASLIAGRGKTFVLRSIERIDLVTPALPDTLWAHAALDPGAEAGGATGSVTAYDDAGRLRVRLTGISLAFLDRAAEPATRLVVASNFTAEPVADALGFWGEQFGAPLELEFTPYNQVLQQLLDPASAFRANRAGVNAVLIGLEEWTTGHPRSLPAPAPQQAEAAFGSRARRVLPNGLEVAHLHRYETDYLYKEIFEDECYARHGIRYEDGATVVDIGANIGLFSLYVKSRCRDPKIYAFEPAPVVYDLLKANAEAYGPGIHALNLGVAEREKTASLTFYEKSSVFSSFHADEADDREAIKAIVRNMISSEGAVDDGSLEQYVDELTADRLNRREQECRMISVSDLIRDERIERIHLLKIDAEKSELDIIAGIADADWPKIDQVVVEIHDRTREAVERVRALLESKGYRCALEEEKLLQRSGLYNLYASRYEAAAADGTGQLHRAAASLQRNIDDFCAALGAFARQSTAPLILAVCPRSPRAAADAALAFALDGAEQTLLARARAIPGVRAIDSAAALRRYPVADYYDAETHRLGHVPYTPDCYAALATELFRAVVTARRKPSKVIVLDCDNTLWKGVCGEDGVAGIELTAPHLALQAFMVGQMEAGMLLCLCSKNAERDVLEVLDRRSDMVLKRGHLAAHRINWEAKSENIRALARELNLGLDSFIFIDDNPLECAEVRAGCPGVLTLQLPQDPEAIPAFLDHVWAFDRAAPATDEDRARTRMVQEDAARQQSREHAYSLRDFIRELGLRIDIAEMADGDLARVSQLTYRTNQFNLTTIRRSEREIRELIAGGHACLTVRVTDRYGDYGLVGVVICESGADRLKVDTLLLSCRVLGRGVEHAILAHLGRRAVAEGRSTVELALRPTDKNQPARDFIERLSARLGGGSGETRVFPAARLASLEYDPDESGQDAVAVEAPVVEPARRSAETPFDRAEPVQRIAESLHRMDLLARAIEARRTRQEPAEAQAGPATASSLEAALLRIWKKVLGRTQIGPTDNFFEAGGTSLKAVQVIAAVKKELGHGLSIVTLFECPTVRLLAGKIGAPAAEPAAAPAASGAALRGQQRRTHIVRRHAS